MIRVRAPSRLHFGLLNIGSYKPWSNVDGEPALPARRFGGVGMMIDEPGIEVRVQPATEWSVRGLMAQRALAFAKRFAETVPDLTPHQIELETQALPHVGLGTGTQLALAVAKALAGSSGHGDWDSVELAGRVRRGARSAIGIHGFEGGGLIVEGGKQVDSDISPLVARFEMPNDWRVLLIIPEGLAGRSGDPEQKAFDELKRLVNPHEVDALCRVLLLSTLPALVERDYDTFGESLYDYNARVGEMFAPLQGGRYANRLVQELVTFCRAQGIPGAGQSSWGPVVFAVAPTEDRAKHLQSAIARQYTPVLRVIATRPNNCGFLVDGQSRRYLSNTTS